MPMYPSGLGRLGDLLRKGNLASAIDLADLAALDALRTNATGIILPRSGIVTSVTLITGTSLSFDLFDGVNSTNTNNRALGTISVTTAAPVYTFSPALLVISGLRVVQTGAGTAEWSLS